MLSAILLAAILLFAPLAQSSHLAEHDFSIEDVHCQVCLSSVMDDDYNIDGDLQTLEPYHSTSIHVPQYLSKLSVSIRFYSSRAPPNTL
ncbi:hypothetical protein RGQ13_16160 [Thalassotalea psychrophila]|uniref:HMA domain-containing protein n=1 Tax=Thalassotalea psychrophila TaxID=3065647 RepID=A0ABY9TSC9_9GAMM|nr:hypothetical protein RGQ13_16160 [Colwelliaceae bacterium SQ149]